MKKFATTIASLFFTFALLYLPLSFAAWSFNPQYWNHFERFVFAFCFVIFIAYSLLKKFIPPAILKV